MRSKIRGDQRADIYNLCRSLDKHDARITCHVTKCFLWNAIVAFTLRRLGLQPQFPPKNATLLPFLRSSFLHSQLPPPHVQPSIPRNSWIFQWTSLSGHSLVVPLLGGKLFLEARRKSRPFSKGRKN